MASKRVQNRRKSAGTDDEQAPASGFEVAARIVGATMLAVQIVVIFAVLIGARDNQGIIYACSIPFFTYLVGVPVGLVLSLLGRQRSGRGRQIATTGLWLTLSGPVVFILFLIIRMISVTLGVR